MFGMKDRERALYERLLDEKERLIVALSDQVDWHRAQSGTVFPSSITQPSVPVMTEEEAAVQQILERLQVDNPQTLYASEDEEELIWQLRHGAADPETVVAALENVRGNTELPFDAE